MKKTIVLYGIVLLSICLPACKKGEDDPSFSLRSRKSRVAGDWKLESGNSTLSYKSKFKKYSDEVFIYTGDTYTLTMPGKGSKQIGAHTINLSFTKDGTFSFNQQYNSKNYDATGSWDFMGAIGEDKKKERISFRINTITGGSNALYTFNKGVTFFNYRIVELRNKKIVLEAKEELIDVNSNDSISYSVSAKYTFIQ